jgi:hypothetical protein
MPCGDCGEEIEFQSHLEQSGLPDPVLQVIDDLQ